MGMHLGLIVAKASVEELKAAILDVCPQLELVAEESGFQDAEDIWAWKEANEQFVSAADWSKDNPGKTVYLFWPDGKWALMLDPEYVLASDERLLAKLSSILGRVLAFVVETAGGCAFFGCFENGSERRRIMNSDGDVATEGEPLPEEHGIDVDNYYMDETEALWGAFGLSPQNRFSSPVGCVAMSVTDRTGTERGSGVIVWYPMPASGQELRGKST